MIQEFLQSTLPLDSSVSLRRSDTDSDKEMARAHSEAFEIVSDDGETDSTSEPPTGTDDGGDNTKGGYIILPVYHTGLDGKKFFEDNPITFGRSDTAGFFEHAEDNTKVSRKQFTMFKESDGYYIEDGVTSVQDKPSGNHTTVNGKDITGQGKIKLNAGDEIGIPSIYTTTFQIN